MMTNEEIKKSIFEASNFVKEKELENKNDEKFIKFKEILENMKEIIKKKEGDQNGRKK